MRGVAWLWPSESGLAPNFDETILLGQGSDNTTENPYYSKQGICKEDSRCVSLGRHLGRGQRRGHKPPKLVRNAIFRISFPEDLVLGALNNDMPTVLDQTIPIMERDNIFTHL